MYKIYGKVAIKPATPHPGSTENGWTVFNSALYMCKGGHIQLRPSLTFAQNWKLIAQSNPISAQSWPHTAQSSLNLCTEMAHF